MQSTPSFSSPDRDTAHGGFINLASGATSVLRIDPQWWQRIRRVNKRNTLLSQRQVGLRNSRGSCQIPMFKLQLFEALADYQSHTHRIPPGLNYSD
jgi:hypothetical protein